MSPTQSEEAGAAAVAEQEHGQVSTSPVAGLKPKPVNANINPDGSVRLAPTPEKPEEERELTEEERAQLAKEHEAARDKHLAAEQALNERVAAKAAELDKAQPEGPQELRVRPGIHSHRLGMVISRPDGSYTAEQLGHRAMRDITLNPGDKLLIAPLGSDTLRDFMRMADMAPASGEQA